MMCAHLVCVHYDMTRRNNVPCAYARVLLLAHLHTYLHTHFRPASLHTYSHTHSQSSVAPSSSYLLVCLHTYLHTHLLTVLRRSLELLRSITSVPYVSKGVQRRAAAGVRAMNRYPLSDNSLMGVGADPDESPASPKATQLPPAAGA